MPLNCAGQEGDISQKELGDGGDANVRHLLVFRSPYSLHVPVSNHSRLTHRRGHGKD